MKHHADRIKGTSAHTWRKELATGRSGNGRAPKDNAERRIQALWHRIAMMIACAALSSCISLKVEQDTDAKKVDAPPKEDSLSYNLSQTTIAVTGTVTLNDCDSIVAKALLDAKNAAKTKDSKDNQPQTLPDYAPVIDVTEGFVVSYAAQADPSHQYQIPIKKLEGWTKQLNLTVARNSNKTLVSINGTITDQAGPTILAAAQAAIAIGGAIAVPEITIPAVTAGALAAAAPRANSLEKVRLNTLGDTRISMDDVVDILHLQTPADKAKWNDIYRRAALTEEIKAINEALKKKTPAPPPQADQTKKFCSKGTEAALKEIAEQQVLIANAAAKASAAKPATDSSAPQPQTDPTVTKAQARIATITAQNHLVRQFTATWTPTRADLKGKPLGKQLILTNTVDLYTNLIAQYWLTDDGKAAVKAALPQADPVLTNLRKPLSLELYIRPWTVGREYGEDSLVNTEAAMPVPPGYPDGLVYRDPALALLRTCLGPCGGRLTGDPNTPHDRTDIAPGILATDDLDNQVMETTTDTTPAVTIPIAQLGRLYLQPLRNVMFQTSQAALTMNADGSIASVGTQSSSAVAAGLTSAAGAANGQASAVAAHNTAIGAQNTAAAADASFADTVNKALADCLTQQAAITKAGGHPVPCQ